jgi:hypothetical protein
MKMKTHVKHNLPRLMSVPRQHHTSNVLHWRVHAKTCLGEICCCSTCVEDVCACLPACLPAMHRESSASMQRCWAKSVHIFDVLRHRTHSLNQQLTGVLPMYLYVNFFLMAPTSPIGFTLAPPMVESPTTYPPFHTSPSSTNNGLLVSVGVA